jgi:hypothetical protein
MTIPDTETIVEPGIDPDVRQEWDRSIEDNFRHIVCYLCYPEFASRRVAPHDAECICGKQLRAGQSAGPASAPECILCNEMANPHYRSAHARQ